MITQKHFLSLADYSSQEVRELLETAADLKRHPQLYRDALKGKVLAMIFEKSSTRTRVSFEVGMSQLGGQALFLSSNDLQLGRGETIADTAQVLGRYVDGIMARTFAHSDVEDLARYSGVPVINGLTDLLHPCQAMADVMTIQEKKGRLAGIRLAYVGDSNNVTHSLLQAGAKFGMQVRVASPAGYQPNPEILDAAREQVRRSGGEIRIGEDPTEAVHGADVVYTDTWASMGQEGERDTRLRVFRPYQVDGRLMAQAAADALFMHCLPAHRGEEVTAEVMDGPHSVVFDEAENRLHVQKAILALLMA